jgi:hypothetical protein
MAEAGWGDYQQIRTGKRWQQALTCAGTGWKACATKALPFGDS